MHTERSVKSTMSSSSVEAARQKITSLWQVGDLFHNFSRYPERADLPRIDRLAKILRRGLVPPSLDQDKDARSDLNIIVTGTDTPYDSVVFLHRCASISNLYISSRPGFFTALLDPALNVLNKDEMGKHWPVLCRDEVYVKGEIPAQRLVGLVVHPSDAKAVISEFETEINRLSIPIYKIDGVVLWPTR